MPKSAAPSANPNAAVGSCAGCSRLDAPTITLLSGAVACTWCPAWLVETRARQLEANAVLAMPDRANRQAHIAAREAEFGPEYRRRLEAVILQTWEARRRAASAF